MKEVLIVFQTDAWLTNASKDIIAVCTSMTKCIKGIREFNKKNDYPSLSADDVNMLKTQQQTQGREYNYFIEKHTVI